MKYCLKCKEIRTFCECEKPITDTQEYIDHLESENKQLRESIKHVMERAFIAGTNRNYKDYTGFETWYNRVFLNQKP